MKKNSKRYWNKRAIEMSFSWIFAIIAGVFILFFAIYFASSFINTAEKSVGTETAAQLVGFLDPMETGFGSLSKPEEISFKKDTRTFYTCSANNNQPFGRQTLAFAEIGLNGKYGEKSYEVSINNKYIFAQDVLQGKKLSAFSKPFSIGFSVGDITVLSSEDYCFYQAPLEFRDLKGISNIHFEDNFANCTGIKVCFADKGGCDIVVSGDCKNVDCDSYDFGTVINRDKGYSTGYLGNLVYGAIFSSKDIYDCNVQRLLNKFNKLGKIYLEKQKILERDGCSNDIEIKLTSLIDSARNINSSRDLVVVYGQMKTMDSMNSLAAEGCKLY